jgi:hypothetical protein
VYELPARVRPQLVKPFRDLFRGKGILHRDVAVQDILTDEIREPSAYLEIRFCDRAIAVGLGGGNRLGVYPDPRLGERSQEVLGSLGSKYSVIWNGCRELDQIQFLLGHVSVQTTEKYLRCQQRIRGASTTAWELNLSNERPPARRVVALGRITRLSGQS